MRKFDAKFKRKVVRGYLSGKGGYKLLAAKFGIADSLVRKWVGADQHHGSAGLVRQRGRYTGEFKLEVLHRLAAENLSCRELAAMYNIGNPHSITMWQQQHERGELRSPQRIPPIG
jgi:transposase